MTWPCMSEGPSDSLACMSQGIPHGCMSEGIPDGCSSRLFYPRTPAPAPELTLCVSIRAFVSVKQKLLYR